MFYRVVPIVDKPGMQRLAVWKSWPLHCPPMAGAELPITPTRFRLRRPRTRSGLLWAALLVLVASFLAIQVGRQVYASWAINQQVAAVRAQMAAVEARNAELQKELEFLQSPAYVSEQARRLQNLGRPGEQVLIIPPGAEQPLPASLLPPVEPPKPMLEQWFNLFFGR
jgi:cell division protein FtsB